MKRGSRCDIARASVCVNGDEAELREAIEHWLVDSKARLYDFTKAEIPGAGVIYQLIGPQALIATLPTNSGMRINDPISGGL